MTMREYEVMGMVKGIESMIDEKRKAYLEGLMGFIYDLQSRDDRVVDVEKVKKGARFFERSAIAELS